MKFSVLLPTRNRLDLLQYAIETVRGQDYDNWEIIVSDNFSEDDINGYVQSLNDQRIKYFRTDSFIPVTDNWNNALDKSEGDYVIMLGDDDGLMQGYFSRLKELIEKYQSPDVIYTGAFHYAYPGVMPWAKNGYLVPVSCAKFMQDASEPFILEKEMRMKMLENSLNFKSRFDYNLQFFLVKQSYIQSLKKFGPFYQSPYPDYYAANVLMLKADKILVNPKPCIAIGISPKSFGFFYFNDLEADGNKFLKNIPDTEIVNQIKTIIMQGVEMNTSWLIAMETIYTNFKNEMTLKVNYKRYRLLQIFAFYTKYYFGKVKVKSQKTDFWNSMNPLEQVLFGIPLMIVCSLVALIFSKRYQQLFGKLLMRTLRVYSRFPYQIISEKYTTMVEVFENIDPYNVKVKRK